MPDDTPVTRGKFLRALGSSMTNLTLGTGLAAAQALASRLAAAVPDTKPVNPVAPAGEKSPLPPDPFVYSGPTEGNYIALTFDDGPTPGVTDRILDELRDRGLSATFFMIGQNIAKAPELACRVAAEGHEIGNHTYTHPKLNLLPNQQADLEIQQTQDIIREKVDYQPRSFRPPYLAFRRNQAFIAEGKGLRVICGDVSSRDWAQPGEDQIVEAILSQTKAGSIIICHDMYEQTANCTGRILDELLERGFKFLTVSSLLAQSQPSQLQ